MKRRLNILCIIVILVLSYSVLESLYYVGVGANLGMKASAEAVEEIENSSEAIAKKNNYQEMANLKYVTVIPHAIKGKNGELLTDSVYNEKTGDFVPVMHGTMAIGLETHEGIAGKILSYLLGLIPHSIVGVWAIILFVKIIVAINRSDIFNWRNVRRLRRLGVLLLIGFGCSLLSEFLSLCSLRDVLTLSNYDLVLSDMVSITTLVLGLSALIVGEVFAIGLKMKEEQDLTI